jgi:hypothetical protein
MKHVYLILDEKNIVAVYDDETLATTMKPALEGKFQKTLKVEKRSVNQDIKMIGVVK